MKWIDNMSDKIKKGVRSWLQITPSTAYNIMIQEMTDFELSAIRNRIWYRGDGNELIQMYKQMQEYADRFKFWASESTPGMEMRKIHTGLPRLIVRTLSAITLTDMNDFDFKSDTQAQLWEEIAKDNDFSRLMDKALQDTLVVGDGAFKIVIDTVESEYPIIEWVPGERIEIIRKYGRLKEIIFKTPLPRGMVLHEHYGRGYIRNQLYKGEQEIDFKTCPETMHLSDWAFDESLLLAVPFQIFPSSKYEGRGGSVFDGKLDSFDALDETWSQWMDALRAGRAKTYIPESFIPRNPTTGALMKPNAFDNRFIAGDNNMAEDGKNTITTEQPAIPHDSYTASYITALDLCLQGIISPSTLGIDTKKLDNAEAQREKEKTTLYTRQSIVDAIEAQIPELVKQSINALHTMRKESIEEIEVDIPFGEYANPSFESQVETVAKGKTGGIMSIQACVDELYGDSRDEEWKAEEVSRLMTEQGITEVEEPALTMSAGSFSVDLEEEEEPDAGQGAKSNVSNESPGAAGASEDSQRAGADGNLRGGKE